MWEFKIPMLPPSMNEIYGWNSQTREKYLKIKGRNFKTTCKLFSPASLTQITAQTPLQVYFEFHGNWFYKNGNFKRHDGQNLMKVLYDAIFEKIGIDDCHVWDGRFVKVQDSQTYTYVRITEIKEENNSEKI